MYHIYHVPQPYGRYYQPSIDYYNGFRQISIQEAMNIALGRVPGQVVKVELDQENGMWVYEVDIITPQGVKYEVEVDINTGAIIKVEVD